MILFMTSPIPTIQPSATGPRPTSGESPYLFDARLMPHRSLGPRGFVIFMSGICLVSFAAGLAFFLAGAWPVVGFLGADVLLIYLAFRINYRRARMYEHLQLTEDRLTVRRVSHLGKEQTWELQPYWLQVQIHELAENAGRLILRSHGKSLGIGAFLTPKERTEVARELKAALANLRCGPREA